MHTAPPVRYPIKPSRLRQAGEGGVFILALTCVGLWAYQTRPSMAWGLSALCLCLLALAFMVRSAWAAQSGELAWDGVAWSLRWQTGREPVWGGHGSLNVLLDLQVVLLLRWRAVGLPAGQWIWLERRSQPSRWHLLRCAVYSRAALEPSKEPIGP